MQRQANPYPLGVDDWQYQMALQSMPQDVLEDEIQIAQLLLLSLKGTPSEEVAAIQFNDVMGEKKRRDRVYRRNQMRPIDLRTARGHKPDLSARFAAIKERWPIDLYCEQLLGVRLRKHGRDSLFGACPLPGHNEKTDSFHVTPSKGLAWCFGCNRGGDVIKLTRIVMGDTRPVDALERLERESGIAA